MEVHNKWDVAVRRNGCENNDSWGLWKEKERKSDCVCQSVWAQQKFEESNQVSTSKKILIDWIKKMDPKKILEGFEL